MQSKVKALREEKGCSQEQLAEMAGLSTRTIQRIERGQRAGLESWKSLAAVFETTIRNLQGKNEMSYQATPLAEEEQKTLNIVRAIMGMAYFHGANQMMGYIVPLIWSVIAVLLMVVSRKRE